MIPIPNALKVTLFSRYYNLEYELRAFHVATGCFYTGSKGGQVLRFAFNAGSSRWEVRARSGPEGEGIKAIARHHGSETLFIGTSGGQLLRVDDELEGVDEAQNFLREYGEIAARQAVWRINSFANRKPIGEYAGLIDLVLHEILERAALLVEQKGGVD